MSRSRCMANLKHAIKQGIVALKAKNIQPVMQTVGDESLLKGKTALVVGGSGGIGKAVAKAFLKNGANVIIAGTRRAKVDKVVLELGEKCAGIVVNLAEPETFSNVIDEAVAFYGPIDILVNSAGVHTEDVSMGGFLDFSVEEYDRILDINLRGVYFMVQSVAKRMISDKVSNGHILIVSSSAGNEPAWSPYRVSKWGLKGITEGMASALVPHGIVVNAIAPGSTATPLLGVEEGDSISAEDNRLGRFAMPEEIAEFAVMLASPIGDMVVGDTLYVSGGRGVCDIR